MTKKRVRSVPIYVWVRPEELEAIRERMAEAGIQNLSAYVRKGMCSMLTSPTSGSWCPCNGAVPTT